MVLLQYDQRPKLPFSENTHRPAKNCLSLSIEGTTEAKRRAGSKHKSPATQSNDYSPLPVNLNFCH